MGTTIFIFWAIMGAASAIVARSKARSVPGWFFIGFLFGPLGFLASLFAGKNEQGLEQLAIARGGVIKCPFCAEIIKSEASICRFCGKAVELDTENQTAKLVVEQDVQKALSTEILKAAEEGQLVKVSQLLKDGANASAADENGVTPLMLAAKNGDAQMIKWLLDAGAETGAKDSVGDTALIYAERCRHKKAAEQLRQIGH